MSNTLSTRVNAARLPDFVGKTVRLACKPIERGKDSAVVQASDGGEVKITYLANSVPLEAYVEVIGTVENSTTIKMISFINLGSDLNMKLVNDTIELIHDPRFFNRMFTS